MIHNNDEVLKYWNLEEVESMYDKHLLNAEIGLIKSFLTPNSKILDAGCGEGEGTLHYATVPNVIIHAVDFSETRLKKASDTLKGNENVTLRRVDFLNDYILDKDYDVIISQRFLINLMDWNLQKKVISDLIELLKPGGKLMLLEGSTAGADELNRLREFFGLPPIPIKWHNLYFNEIIFNDFIKEKGFEISNVFGFGEYFLLTRGLRPFFDSNLNWDSDFNRLAAKPELRDIINLNTKFSRLKLWIIKNK